MENGKYYINGKDAFLTYGLLFMPGIYAELLKLPKKKASIIKDWTDQNGTQRLLPITPFFESINYSFPLYHFGNNETDFYTKYAAWSAFIQSTNYFTFDVVEMNKRYTLLYDNMPSFDKLTIIKGAGKVYCSSTISFINDYPTLMISPAQDVLNKFVANVAADGGIYDFSLLSQIFNEGSAVQEVVIEPVVIPVTPTLTTPSTPTNGVVNDTANTFDFTYASGITNNSQYEQTLDGGSTWTALTAKPIAVGDIAKAINQVGVRVKAVSGVSNESGILYNATAFTVAPIPTLASPTISASTASTTQINLSWGAISNAQAYVLERASNSGFTAGLVTLYTGSNLSLNDTGLSASTQYFYRLKATASGYTTSGYGSANATTQTIVLTTPATPTLLAVSDVKDTFDFNYVSGYGSISQYEYTLDGGSTWTTMSVKPLQVGNIAKAANQVGIRVKAVANTSNASGILYNSNPFTLAQTQGTAVAVSGFAAGTPTTSAIPLSWTESNVSLAHGAKMVVIGSSTSAGNGASPIANSVINKITAYFQGLYNNFVTVNSAVAGQSSYQLLPTGSPAVANRPAPNTSGNVTWAIAQNPSFVLINIPTNDTADGYTNDEYLSNLNTITNALTTAGIKYFITTTQPRNTNQYVADSLRALCDIIKNAYGVNVLDWYTPIANLSTNFIASAYDSGDGTHVNNAGHALLFEAAKPAIQTYIENTIKNDYYVIQSLVSGSWNTIMNNVNRFLTSVQLTGLSENTAYTLRIGSVTKGSGIISYSSSVSATTATVVTAPTSQRILFDLGGADSNNAVSTDVDQWGKKWNTILNAAVRNAPYKWIENPVDINNVAAPGLIFQASQDAAVGFAGVDSMNPDGYAGNVGDYPASACRDSHYAHINSGVTNLTITVPSGKKITSLKVWGSRAAAGPRMLQMKKNADATWQEYEAANNSTYNNAITITNIPAGTNVLNF
jgi:lysophospholipase L1-like esterase